MRGIAFGLLVVLGLPACRAPEVTATDPGADGAAGGFGFNVAEAGAAERSGAGGESCAYQAFAAERLPLDLVVLVDASGSMADLVEGGGRSKWQMAQEALAAFARDPGSAGLGIGLQFFPLVGPGTPCASATDCGYPAPVAGVCKPRQLCVGPGQPPGGGVPCGELETPACLAGTACQPVGTCALSGAACANVGGACTGGAAGDSCRAEPATCVGSMPICAPDSYARLAAAIAELPGALPSFVRLLSMRRAGGATPMAEAVIGTLTHLRARAMEMPRRRAALILATDGLPSGCSARDVPIVADAIWSARNTPPAVPSYVVGLLDPADRAAGQSALSELARAGGSDSPFLLDPQADLTRTLLEALNRIRGDALPCAYAIPPQMKGAIDFDRVNVAWKSTAGGEAIPYVGSAGQCHATRGGWYFDVDPRQGTPTHVVICPASCARLKTEQAAQVELRFGCKTIVIE
jgi:hypothetical protein